jgi:transcriptional regulator with XRE-family HTH domain
VKFLENRLLELKHKKTQAEIAEEAGFINPNMVTMIKQGATKLPIARIPALAKALDCDPALLLRFALEQSEGSTAASAIFEIIGQPITVHEMTWITEIREASGDTDPRLTSRANAAIRGVFGK